MDFFSVGYPEKERIEITLIGSPKHPQSDPYSWAKARVQINVVGFSGDMEIYMDVDDMVRFKAELEPMYKNVAGVAEFKTMEDQVYIKLEVDNLGHVEASGYLKDLLGENKLTFEFSYDQTLLLHTISEIDELLSNLKLK